MMKCHSDGCNAGPLEEGQVGSFGPSTYAVTDLSFRSAQPVMEVWRKGDVQNIGRDYETVFLFHTQVAPITSVSGSVRRIMLLDCHTGGVGDDLFDDRNDHRGM